MESQIWVVSTLLISIVLIVLTIVKTEVSPVSGATAGKLFRRRHDGHEPAGYG
ncbi:D-serine permease DsdX [Klebsiella michiganensis]|uniref:D-serine permease DsdX n=1 Tax=Klebsiella michiganensis TaxID=1134687 RepID=A0A7H4PEZ9_9ENTR|nr:D-serine permease DsdX [Klebsiella michiganensis]